MSASRSVVSSCLRPHGLYSPWNSPGQTIGVGSLSLLQGILPSQGSNPGLPHCRRILYQLSHQGSPIYHASSYTHNLILLPLHSYLFQYLRHLRHSVIWALISSLLKVAQSCPTLCDPVDGSPTGSPIPGIFQARTLEWVTISFSSA